MNMKKHCKNTLYHIVIAGGKSRIKTPNGKNKVSLHTDRFLLETISICFQNQNARQSDVLNAALLEAQVRYI